MRWRWLIVKDKLLTAADRHVALTLALHMDKHGAGAYPSITTLARQAQRKRHTVIASLQKLERLGYLEIEHGGITPGSEEKTPNRYQAWCPKGHQETESPGAPRDRPLVPLGTHELRTTNSRVSHKNKNVCPECELGGGRHLEDCSLIKEKTA
jgi:DNA-binding transcriptional MocR family regulator